MDASFLVVIVVVRSVIGRMIGRSSLSSLSPVCQRRQIITVHSDGDGVSVEIKIIRIILGSNLASYKCFHDIFQPPQSLSVHWDLIIISVIRLHHCSASHSVFRAQEVKVVKVVSTESDGLFQTSPLSPHSSQSLIFKSPDVNHNNRGFTGVRDTLILHHQDLRLWYINIADWNILG